MRHYIPKALLAMLAGFLSFSASAQPMGGFHSIYQRPFRVEDYTEATPFWQRTHLTITMPVVGIKAAYKYVGHNAYGRREEESYVMKMPQRNYGYGIGTFFRLTDLGEKSKLCLSTDFNLDVHVWESEPIGGTVSYYGLFETGSTGYTILAGMMNFSVPVTIDYKSGCDVMQSKEYNSCFAMGAGFTFNKSLTTFYDIQGASPIYVRPVIKMEAGFRMGMCFKLRAMYQMGRVNYLQYKSDPFAGYEETFSFYSKGTFLLSFLIIPTAFSWEKY